jgi:hypothetical protein
MTAKPEVIPGHVLPSIAICANKADEWANSGRNGFFAPVVKKGFSAAAASE